MIHVPYMYWGNLHLKTLSRISLALTSFNNRITALIEYLSLQCLNLKSVRPPQSLELAFSPASESPVFVKLLGFR